MSFSFRLLFSFSQKQAPLPRELANTGHTVTQCVLHSPIAKPEPDAVLMAITLPSEEKEMLEHNANNVMQRERFKW